MILVGHALEQLRTLPDKSVDLIVTSPEGGVVLDMFGGTGTTGEVALSLGRDFILIELNGDYVEKQMRPRLAKVTPGFRFGEVA